MILDISISGLINKRSNLYTHIRCSHKKERYGKKYHRVQIPHRISIDERPEIVDQKKRVGDWEIDTIIEKKSSRRFSVSSTTKISL